MSKGKDYVICFRKIGTGKNYAGDIEKLDKEGKDRILYTPDGI